MKKKLLLAVICVMASVGVAFSQTQSLTFNDNDGTADSGTYNPNDSFGFDVFLSFDYPSTGYTLFLEVMTTLAPNISITGSQYFTFTDETDNGFPKVFNGTEGASPGFLTNNDAVINPQTGSMDAGDLGATGSFAASPGGVQVLHLTFQLNGAAPGTYTLQSTATGPARDSIVTDNTDPNNKVDRDLPAEQYFITVVPEPSTFALLGMAAAGAGVAAYRRRRALR